MTSGSLAPLIKTHYPEYYIWEQYPQDTCVPIRKVKEEWGILGNFYPAPLVVCGIRFDSSEQLFQMLKFTEKDILISLYSRKGLPLKWEARKWGKEGRRRQDWGEIIIDVMKFCLLTKYDQCEEFRKTLNQTKGKNIVEDQTSMKTTKSGRLKPADTWGAVRVGDRYEGSNLLGRLLMELRDNGKLDYRLPENIFDSFIALGGSAH